MTIVLEAYFHAKIGGYQVYYPSNIFRNTYGFENLGIWLTDIPNFS